MPASFLLAVASSLLGYETSTGCSVVGGPLNLQDHYFECNNSDPIRGFRFASDACGANSAEFEVSCGDGLSTTNCRDDTTQCLPMDDMEFEFGIECDSGEVLTSWHLEVPASLPNHQSCPTGESRFSFECCDVGMHKVLNKQTDCRHPENNFDTWEDHDVWCPSAYYMKSLNWKRCRHSSFAFTLSCVSYADTPSPPTFAPPTTAPPTSAPPTIAPTNAPPTVAPPTVAPPTIAPTGAPPTNAPATIAP
ncbi:hypothetical protein DIPPA_56722, partial [Diplonema papillatum]